MIVFTVKGEAQPFGEPTAKNRKAKFFNPVLTAKFLKLIYIANLTLKLYCKSYLLKGESLL